MTINLLDLIIGLISIIGVIGAIIYISLFILPKIHKEKEEEI